MGILGSLFGIQERIDDQAARDKTRKEDMHDRMHGHKSHHLDAEIERQRARDHIVLPRHEREQMELRHARHARAVEQQAAEIERKQLREQDEIQWQKDHPNGGYEHEVLCDNVPTDAVPQKRKSKRKTPSEETQILQMMQEQQAYDYVHNVQTYIEQPHARRGRSRSIMSAGFERAITGVHTQEQAIQAYDRKQRDARESAERERRIEVQAQYTPKASEPEQDGPEL